MQESVRIVLADDHAIVRQGIRRVIESSRGVTVVAEASSGAEAVEMVIEHEPQVIVLDIGMRGLNGLEAAGQIRRRRPDCRIVMLSMHSDERYVNRAVKQGADAYVLKDAAEGELLTALDHVTRGERFFSPSLSPILQEDTPLASAPDDRYELLTERERHIYQLLAEGNVNKDIANSLGLSLHTVETHRSRIMEKLGVHNAAELVLSAVRRGIVS